MNKVIFFDRDGIVNRRKIDDYIKTKNEFEFEDNFFDIFSLVKEKGYLAILITNQQGVGKGLMSIDDLENIHQYMQHKLIEKTKHQFDFINYCTDLADSNSIRRKPNTGMLEEACNIYNVSIKDSYFIGDTDSDIQTAKNFNLKSILIANKITPTIPDYHFVSIKEIIEYDKSKKLF